MPAYNEEENIENTVKQWHPVVEKIGFDSKLVIVNDGSKDSTYRIMQNLAIEFNQFIPLTKPNTGHGPTCLYAYEYAIKENATYIFQTDSDGQTNPDEFWKFWDNRAENDFIIGWRCKRLDGILRILVSHVLRIVIYLIFGVWLQDANTPFRLMKSDRIKKFLRIIPDDLFLCNVAISALAVKYNEKIIWYPITFKPRQGGKNSINSRRIIKIGLKAIMELNDINKKFNDQY